MDDLAGLDWSATNSVKSNSKPAPTGMNQSSFYQSTLRPTPSPQASGHNTPLSSQGSGFNAPKPATSKPATDNFSNLVNFGGAKSNASLSLRERQEQLEAEKRRKEEEQRKQMLAQYGGGQFWDRLGQGSANASRTATPAIPLSGSGSEIGVGQIGSKKDDDDDLFAAFNKDTKVDNASHYPPPTRLSSGKSTPASDARLDLGSASAWNQPPTSGGADFNDDDDIFGLNQVKANAVQQQTPAMEDDDDFLGDLGKPVEEVRRKTQASQPKPEPGKPVEASDSESDSEPETAPPRGAGRDNPFDKALVELVDMGFSAENARRGLTESGAGINVQAAVGWLLDDAHRTARQQKQTTWDTQAERSRPRDDGGRSRNNASPAWMREGQELPPRRDTRSPASGGDLQQKAAAMGTSFFKTANSLWKTGQKQVQKAVAEFNQEGGDPNQPKWMRSAQQDRMHPEERQQIEATDEAMMLESGIRPERPAPRSSSEPQPGSSRFGDAPRDRSPAFPMRPSEQSSAAPKRQQTLQSSLDPQARLSKQVIEDQSAQAYVSPARRKKTPQPPPKAEPEPDLLFSSTALPLPQSHTQRTAQPSSSLAKSSNQPASRTITPRPTAPPRQIPAVSPAAIQASTQHRLDGAAHFKRGDYDSAHNSYSNSLQGIPQTHPLCIVLLTNRSLTALKTGSPKQAVEDADAAIMIIGPSRGEGEKIDLGDGEQRHMKDLYGKALSRKAEALEQMEKWSDAGIVWQLCVEAGVGGATAIAGRQRCQKALAPKPKPTPKPVQGRPKPSAASDLGPQKSYEAVERLRAANQAAEKADDEKFALGEKVDARISAWRDGKRDNLRALLGSLDQVLWEGSGWKKVGLHELVMANKVKIHYIKAIARCHPDKLPQDASTEVKLIAATVFATLNESWDKFKAENGL